MYTDKEISDLLYSRGIKKILCFHIDHFEPTTLDSNKIIEERHIDSFIEKSNSQKHTRKMSLFFRPTFAVISRDEDDGYGHFFEDDSIGFVENDITISSGKILKKISEETKMDIQLHIHHEHFTRSEEPARDAKIRELINAGTMADDEKRFSLYLNMCLRFLRNNTGRDFKTWHFVHGKWGLNASDRRVCQLEGELDILRRAGCSADFTFPAGRKKCDPHIRSPFSCLTPSIWRSYDYINSDPMAINFGSKVMVKNRITIWNSRLKHPTSSIDNYSDVVAENISNHGKFIYDMIAGSPIINGTLFFKTYSHSLSSEYEVDGEYKFPLLDDNINSIFDKLSKIAYGSRVSLKYVTSDEVFKALSFMDNGDGDAKN